MPNTTGVTIYADEEFVEAFDDKVWQLKQAGELDRNASRSEVIRRLMEGLVEGNLHSPTSVRKIVS